VSTAIRRALYGKLAGDSTLTTSLGVAAPGYTQAIYHEVAPEGAQFPYLIFQKQAGTPTGTFGVPSAMENDVWLVKAVDRSTTADAAEAIAKRVADLLNDASLSISGATLCYLRRESDVQFPEVVDGVTYRHAGSLFRLVYT